MNFIYIYDIHVDGRHLSTTHFTNTIGGLNPRVKARYLKFILFEIFKRNKSWEFAYKREDKKHWFKLDNSVTRPIISDEFKAISYICRIFGACTLIKLIYFSGYECKFKWAIELNLEHDYSMFGESIRFNNTNMCGY